MDNKEHSTKNVMRLNLERLAKYANVENVKLLKGELASSISLVSKQEEQSYVWHENVLHFLSYT